MLNPGHLDRRIELQRRVLTQDAQGQQVQSFETYATVWAEKRDIAGREYFAAEAVQSQVTTRFRIRWRSDVLATDRIAYDAKSYDLEQIAEIGRRDGIELLAVAVQP